MTGFDGSADDDYPSGVNGTIRTTFDWETVAPSTAVIKTISVAVNAEPTAIEPLYGAIDP